jgi:hypothetical protein
MTLSMFDADEHCTVPVVRTKDGPEGRLLPALGAPVSAIARALHLGRSFGVVAVTGTDGSGCLRVTATVNGRRHAA